MNTEYLLSFIETVKSGSISKASDKLNMTHTALSKQIRKLEEHFNVSLFNRSSSGVEVTEAGRILYSRIRPLLHELERIEKELLKFKEKKTISLGTLPSLAAYYLPQTIISLKDKGIEVRLVVRNTSSELLNLLESGTVEAAVMEHVPTHKSFWAYNLFHEPFYVILPKTHVYSDKTSVSIHELASQPLVVYPAACSIRKNLQHMFEIHNLIPMFDTEVEFGDFIPGYVAAGAGLAVLPKISVKHLGHPALKALPLSHKDAHRSIALITKTASTGEWVTRNIKQK
ncbi:LysR family transcriptional regulator [Aneurinibacillus sp. Ricciae_BoGa-3]|uniref:LysR family transcriptional regulator n=1 Tax=Aneurinibacillus sp. Ricciae_BoGa-3 TaxID=3022697 RepID=UPI00234289F8|nr:LysR family transcriptional regulator [Aneurinibacillus sp. Ricciae_BoGa-3]WCK54927.1 LysR family transcriptional regulator [Aneurinibacillus sp. Ricciae_BoGa-3]